MVAGFISADTGQHVEERIIQANVSSSEERDSYKLCKGSELQLKK